MANGADMRRRALCLLLAIGAVLGPLGGATPAPAAEEPALSVAPDLLAAALVCPDFTGAPPVLLVHGTATNSADTWAPAMQPALGRDGYDVCTVDLPGRALGDIQVSAEYVVHAIRHISTATGRKVAVVGHSQGSLEPRWALKWWPSLQAVVSDVVVLAAPNHGVFAADGACAADSCAPAVWQMTRSSALLRRLNAGDETPGAVHYTSIWSQNDELVQPTGTPAPATAPLQGGWNVVVQNVCPGRPVGHGAMVHDGVVYALVLNALQRTGGADPSSLPGDTCLLTTVPGGDYVGGQIQLYGYAGAAFAGAEHVDAEPPLAPYAA